MNPTPSAMSEQPKYHIFKLSDCEWWMATSAEEARHDYLEMNGQEHQDIIFDDGCPKQLTDEELDRKRFCGEKSNANGQMDQYEVSYREEMARREQKSQYFATTEF